jgi:hypothetical protein
VLVTLLESLFSYSGILNGGAELKWRMFAGTIRHEAGKELYLLQTEPSNRRSRLPGRDEFSAKASSRPVGQLRKI